MRPAKCVTVLRSLVKPVPKDLHLTKIIAVFTFLFCKLAFSVLCAVLHLLILHIYFTFPFRSKDEIPVAQFVHEGDGHGARAVKDATFNLNKFVSYPYGIAGLVACLVASLLVVLIVQVKGAHSELCLKQWLTEFRIRFQTRSRMNTGYARVPSVLEQDNEIGVEKLLLSSSDLEDEEIDLTHPKV